MQSLFIKKIKIKHLKLIYFMQCTILIKNNDFEKKDIDVEKTRKNGLCFT